MKHACSIRTSILVGSIAAVLSMFAPAAQAQLYQVGDTVSDFPLYARRAFTNDLGQVVPAGTQVSLSDFEGKIVFLEFFYYW